MAYHLDRFLAIGPEMRAAWPGSCGPGSLGAVFPDGPFGCVCKFHDFAYLLGGTKEHFYAVERDFKRQLLTAARQSSNPWAWTIVAITYAAWTRTWGWHLRRWRRADRPLTVREMRDTPEYKDAQSRL